MSTNTINIKGEFVIPQLKIVKNDEFTEAPRVSPPKLDLEVLGKERGSETKKIKITALPVIRESFMGL